MSLLSLGHGLVLVSSRRISFFTPLALAALFGLCGCSSVKVHLGMTVRLAKIPVTTIEASMPNGAAIAPGEKAPLVVTFTTPDGKTWVTEGKDKGKVLWNDITVQPTLVTFKKGTFTLPRDPRTSEGKIGHIDIAVPSHPDLHAALDIPLRYNYPFKSNYAGPSGTSGLKRYRRYEWNRWLARVHRSQ